MEEPTRVLKRRLRQPQAPLACEACRIKKVRCDVVTKKTACSKCEHRGITCKIVPGRRRHLVNPILAPESEELSTTDQLLPSFLGLDTASPHPIDTPSTVESQSPSSTASLASIASSMTSMASYEFPEDHIKSIPDEDLLQQTPWADSHPASRTEHCTWKLDQLGLSNMPDLPTRQNLLQTYRSWVHPTLPMLDLRKIDVTAQETSATYSLLFKSVMMAASAFTHCGPDTRQDLRRQVIALLQAHLEPDPLVELQALILLSYGESDPSGVEDEYYWISTACRKAERMLSTGHFDVENSESCRATLWSLMIQDTLISLIKRKPCQLRLQLPSHLLRLPTSDEWFNVGSYEMDCPELTSGLGGEYRQICSALGNLCTSIRPALMEFSSDTYISSLDLLQTLGAWQQTWFPRARSCVMFAEEHKTVHWTCLVGTWSLAVLTFFCCASRSKTPSTAGLAATDLVTTAVSVTTELYQQIYERNLVRHLPSTAVAALAPVTAAHLMNTTSEVSHIQHSSTQKYYLCWQVLRELSTRCHQARIVSSMIDSLGQRLRRGFDTATAEKEDQLRVRAMSMSITSSESSGEALTPPSSMDDHAWLNLFDVGEDEFGSDNGEGILLGPSKIEKAISA